jgi:hypothetical protein
MPYRGDIDALKTRCEVLERELTGLRERSRELGDVQREEARVERDLDAARKMLGDKRALPLLDNVRVASPCKASWDDMTGDAQVRFCGQCAKNVYNLSAMTREEGERLLLEKEGKVCVRFYRRVDGTVMTADCPIGARRVRVRRVAFAAAGGGLVAAAAAYGSMAMMGTPRRQPMQGAVAMDTPTMGEPMEMGSVAAPPAPPPTPQVQNPPHATMGRPAFHPSQTKSGK